MNIQEAKQISLQRITEHFGGRYSHTDRKGDHWCFSPFRPEEKTASFKINVKTNTWHDFGLSGTIAHKNQGSGGDVVDLWCDYHFIDRRSGIKDALKGLAEISNNQHSKNRMPMQPQKRTAVSNAPRYKIIKISDRINFAGLKDELVRRKISLKLANVYLKQGQILDTVTNRKYIGFLFENDKGGFEVSIPNPVKQECFKTCIGNKASTRILTTNDETTGADAFEGFWDFLSWLEMNGRIHPKHHSYILNTTSLVAEVCDKLLAFKDQVTEVFLFMDNDEAGYQATHLFAEMLENDFAVGSCEQIYKNVKDLSQFLMQQR